MIRFRCKNCGIRIRAVRRLAGKKAKCPKCRKPITVPDTSDIKAVKDRYQSLAEKPNAEIAKELLGSEQVTDSQKAAEERKHRFFIPYYDETTLFVMGVTFILLFLSSKTMRADLHKLIVHDFDVRIIICLLFFVVGMVFSILHAFSKREKNIGEKAAMLLFAVFVSAGTGIYAGRHMLETSVGWLIIFPIWNIINGVLLLLMLRMKVIGIDCISDSNAAGGQISLGLIAAIIIFICCQYFFKLHWAITYSICIAYTTSLDKAVQSVFGQR
jgi:hypothetical protein